MFVFDVASGDSLKALKQFYDQIQRIKMSDEDATPVVTKSAASYGSSYGSSLGSRSSTSTINTASADSYFEESKFEPPCFPFIFVGNKIDLLLHNSQRANQIQPSSKQSLTDKEKLKEKHDKKLLRKLDREVRTYIEREIIGIDDTVKDFHLPLFWASAKDNINVTSSYDGLVREMRNYKMRHSGMQVPIKTETKTSRISRLFHKKEDRKTSTSENSFGQPNISKTQHALDADSLRVSEASTDISTTMTTSSRRRWGSWSSSNQNSSRTSRHSTRKTKKEGETSHPGKSSSFPSRRGSFIFTSLNCDNTMEDLF